MRSEPLSAFEILPIPGDQPAQKVRGFFVRSTARIRVEDSLPSVSNAIANRENTQKQLNEIADHLIANENSQLVIFVHGYANKRSDAEARSKQIYEYAQNKPELQSANTVFIGYRWPAENPIQDDPQLEGEPAPGLKEKVQFAFQAMPTQFLTYLIIFLSTLIGGLLTEIAGLLFPFLLKSVLGSGLVIGIGFWSSLALNLFLRDKSNAKALLKLPNVILFVLAPFLLLWGILKLLPNSLGLVLVLLGAIVATSVIGLVAAFLFLRLSAYPGDRFRASNYGVFDLVELIRQIDKALIERIQQPSETLSPVAKRSAAEISESPTQELKPETRIKLSFIAHSLGCEVITQTIRILSDVFSPNAIEGEPDPNIGRIFRLERLVLVAPDIPLESIMPGRTNYLRSAVARCAEAHVFSNEGDLALRLASTAANYFSFPAKTRSRGYKLGNITAKHEQGQKPTYGIVNPGNVSSYKCLEIRASGAERTALADFPEFQSIPGDGEIVTNKFTYFDCTDYKDQSDQPQGLLTMATQKNALGYWDYIQLVIRYFVKKPGNPEYINTHGGYFDGEFSQTLINDIAYLGIASQMSSLDTQCKEKFLQVVLSQDLQS